MRSVLLTILCAASEVSASFVAQARRALAERQSSGQPNAVQNWANDYATETFKTGSNGVFSVDWANGPGGDFVVGRGYQPARDMLVNYTGTFHTTGNAYLALYGWTQNPLVEYYVIESMGNHNPSDNVSSTQYGCMQSDGGTYEIWQKARINAPSIQGDHTNFQQFWSVRTTSHVGGTINTGNHFRAWAAAGLKLGQQLYMDIVIEGQLGGGNATITVGTPPKTSVPNYPTSTYRSQRKAGTCPKLTSTSSIKTSTVTTVKTTTSAVTSTSTKPAVSVTPTTAAVTTSTAASATIVTTLITSSSAATTAASTT